MAMTLTYPDTTFSRPQPPMSQRPEVGSYDSGLPDGMRLAVGDGQEQYGDYVEDPTPPVSISELRDLAAGSPSSGDQRIGTPFYLRSGYDPVSATVEFQESPQYQAASLVLDELKPHNALMWVMPLGWFSKAKKVGKTMDVTRKIFEHRAASAPLMLTWNGVTATAEKVIKKGAFLTGEKLERLQKARELRRLKAAGGVVGAVDAGEGSLVMMANGTTRALGPGISKAVFNYMMTHPYKAITSGLFLTAGLAGIKALYNANRAAVQAKNEEDAKAKVKGALQKLDKERAGLLGKLDAPDGFGSIYSDRDSANIWASSLMVNLMRRRATMRDASDEGMNEDYAVYTNAVGQLRSRSPVVFDEYVDKLYRPDNPDVFKIFERNRDIINADTMRRRQQVMQTEEEQL